MIMAERAPSAYDAFRRDPYDGDERDAIQAEGDEEPQDGPSSLPPLPARDCEGAPIDLEIRPNLVRMSDVKPRAVEWLAYPYLPLGKLSMLSGDPSAGKSFISLALAAGISRGRMPLEQRPDAPPIEPGNVLLLLREDDLEDTVRPRLDLLGADPDRVFALRGTVRSTPDGQEKFGHVSLADRQMIERSVVALKPKLIIVDPLQSFMPAEVDLHRANETRPVLDGLGDLAARARCSVLLLRHLNKAPAARAHYRGLGSIDLTAAVRSELMAGEDVDGSRALVHVKSSLAPKGASIGYELDGVSGLVWCGLVERDAEDLVAARAPKKDPSKGGRPEKRPECIEFLRAQVDGGRLRRALDVIKAAREAGYSERLVRGAAKDAGIQQRRVNVDGSLISMWSGADAPNDDEPDGE
jgi:hypothetical protein